MAGRRAERVGRQVVQALATIVENGVHDPRLLGLTFTSASATDDLRTVRVYFSVFGRDAAKGQAIKGLQSASGFLRRELARRLELRYVPALVFEYDETLHSSERIGQLLSDKDEG